MNKEKRIEELRQSLEHGTITREEFDGLKEQIEQEKEEDDEHYNPHEERPIDSHNPHEDAKKGSDIYIIIALIAVIVILAAGFVWFSYLKNGQPKTIDDFHALNLNGKLKPEQGYVYNNAYSFIAFDGTWYTQLKSPKGTRIYDMAFRFGPRDLEGINIGGFLDKEIFDNSSFYYATFNPNGTQFSHVALAVADFNQHMTNVFFKNPVAACDRNQTEGPCLTRPVITCENRNYMVLYVKEADENRTYYDGNCMVVEGSGFGLVKGVDRILLNLYGIMPQ